MLQRPGRSIAVSALAVASVTALGIATASAAPAATARSVAASAHVKNPLGHAATTRAPPPAARGPHPRTWPRGTAATRCA